MAPLYIGVGLKIYFGHGAGLDWFRRVAATSAVHPAVANGDIVLFVVPTFLQVASAIQAFRGTAVREALRMVRQKTPGRLPAK